MNRKGITSTGCCVGIVLFFCGFASAEERQPNAVDFQGRNEEAIIEFRVRAYRISLYFKSGLHREKFDKKVIYGEDNRKDIHELKPTVEVEKMAKKTANSTCILTSRPLVSKQPTGKYRLTLQPFEYEKCRPCSDEKFRTQLVGGWGSGFLVGPDLVATAGHCCEPDDDDVKKIAFVFGFFAIPPDTTPRELGADQVYFGKKIVKRDLSDRGDYALIQLDRKVIFPGAEPLRLRRKDNPAVCQKVGLIGYPAGLPTKAAYGEDTKIYDVTNVWLRTNLDSFAGNSGSVVTNEEGLVEGILVRGRDDFKIFTPAGGDQCFYSVRLRNSDAGEFVTRASVFADFIPSGHSSPKKWP